MEHLFHPPSLPTVLQSGAHSSTAGAQFMKYKSALRQQLDGRTPLLDGVLSTLERQASDLQRDLTIMLTSERSGRWALMLHMLRDAERRHVATWFNICLVHTVPTRRLSVRKFAMCSITQPPMKVCAFNVFGSPLSLTN